MNRQYYQLTKADNAATINIYGDITSFPWCDGDVSANNLSRQLEQLTDVSEITVYINSYGGEVAEGLAIYNALKRHKATVKTVVDGFACSIASVIFMAGDERIMNDASLLMIHNAWAFVEGNAAELRKQADDLEKITQASVNAYKAHSNLSEEEIKALMDAESWLSPDEALEYGFATAIETGKAKNANQSAKAKLFSIVRAYQKTQDDEEESDDTPDDVDSPETDEPDNPEDEPEDDEPDEGEETEDDSEEENQKEAEQRMNGFFNAFLKFEREVKDNEH